jgi:hypothetical protein
MVFFITGASGSGKSAALPGLRAAFPDMDWRDFDAVGVPQPCPPEWRPRTTQHWLEIALANKDRGLDTGIVGGALLGEILACPSAPDLDGIHVALLDCYDVQRIERLRQRGTHGASQDMLSWAAWQRMHAVDPRWRPDVISASSAPEMNWGRWVGWEKGDPRWQVEIIDTTHLSIPQVVERLICWIGTKRQ